MGEADGVNFHAACVKLLKDDEYFSERWLIHWALKLFSSEEEARKRNGWQRNRSTKGVWIMKIEIGENLQTLIVVAIVTIVVILLECGIPLVIQLTSAKSVLYL